MPWDTPNRRKAECSWSRLSSCVLQLASTWTRGPAGSFVSTIGPRTNTVGDRCHAEAMTLQFDGFIGCRAKIARAQSGVEELVELARTTMRDGPQPTFTVHIEDGWEVVTLRLPGFSAMLSVILGEIVHNVRSALDNAIWSAALANGGTPHGRTAFPIATKADDYRRAVNPPPPKPGKRPLRSPIEGVSSSVTAIVKRHQPFQTVQTGGEVRAEPLAVLHAMWNVDKHRSILRPAAAAPDDPELICALFTWPSIPGGTVEFQHPTNLIGGHWEDGRVIARFRFPDRGLDPDGGYRTRPAGTFDAHLALGFDDYNGFGVEGSLRYPQLLISAAGAVIEEIENAVESSLG